MKLIRCTVSALFGLTVAYFAFTANRDALVDNLVHEPFMTRYGIKLMAPLLDAYKKEKHTLPRRLEDLHIDLNDSVYSDGWGRHYLYQALGEHYVITSYGRDGVPGGIGLDADIKSDNLSPKEERVTFSQLIRLEGAEKMIQVAGISGVFATVLCFALFRPITASTPKMGAIALQLLLLVAGASIVAAIVTGLHLPNPH